MDEPQGGARDGGQVSAPVFRQIAEQILPELNVVPDNRFRQETLTAHEEIPSEIEVEPSAGRNIEEKFAARKVEKTVLAAKVKETKKETKQEPKTPDGEKNLPKQKTAVINNAKPKGEIKNKSSGERAKQKT
jgi:hypothetical protein